MGRTSLSSHENSKKHKELVQDANKSVNLKTFFNKPTNQPLVPTSSAQSSTEREVSSSVEAIPQNEATSSRQPFSIAEKFKVKDSVTEAEIVWCLHTVMHHHSLRSSEDAVHLFQMMFPTCDIAANMRLGKDKIAYSIVYGLGFFFKSKVLQMIRTCNTNSFVLMFDESLNKFAQKQQMDVVVRFWCDETERVTERYLTSIFLLSSTAVDLLEALKEALKGLDLNNILQISMDGPNVNKKMLRLLKSELRPNEDDKKLLEIGSCGLHTVNVAFKTGVKKTGWNLIEFFRAAFFLFKESPARRGLFFKVTNTNILPKKFCTVRWVENIEVSKRAQDVLPHLKTYVDSVKSTNRPTSVPISQSFNKVDAALKDPLLLAKIAFFQSVSEVVEPFLRAFQGEVPMVPFLYEDLLFLVKSLMEKIVKPEILTTKAIKEIDVFEKVDNIYVNLIPSKSIDLSYGTRSAIRKCKGYNEKQLQIFRQECRTCLQHITKHLLDKSPLIYPLSEHITFLNPKKTASNKECAIEHMKKTFDIILESNLVPASVIEKADREFKALLEKEYVVDRMKNYDRTETRLDEFWMDLLKKENVVMTNLEKIVKLLLPMSHGNASVERGFSINGDLIVENLQSDSLIAQRLVYDHVKSAGGIKNVKITNELKLSMRNANSRWKLALEEKRSQKTREEREAAEKRKASAMVKELEKKRIRVMEEAKKAATELDEQIKKLTKSN